MSDVLDRPTDLADEVEAAVSEQAEEGAEEAQESGGEELQIVARTKKLTKGEEEKLFSLFVNTQMAQEFIILEAFEGQAHRAVGMASFEDYCRDRLGLSYSAARLSQICAAARVQRRLIGGYSPLSAEGAPALPAVEPKKMIPGAAAREIGANLPEAVWKATFEEWEAFSRKAKKDGKTNAEISEELKRIVKRKHKELYPDESKAPKKKGAAAHKVREDKPAKAKKTKAEPEQIAPERLERMKPVQAMTYEESQKAEYVAAGGDGSAWDSMSQDARDAWTEENAKRPAVQGLGATAVGGGGIVTELGGDYPPGYTARLEERLKEVESLLSGFLFWMEPENQGNAAYLMKLHLDAQRYAEAHGLPVEAKG